MLWSGYEICECKCYGLAMISVIDICDGKCYGLNWSGYEICDGKYYGLAMISVMVSAMVWLRYL